MTWALVGGSARCSQSGLLGESAVAAGVARFSVKAEVVREGEGYSHGTSSVSAPDVQRLSSRALTETDLFFVLVPERLCSDRGSESSTARRSRNGQRFIEVELTAFPLVLRRCARGIVLGRVLGGGVMGRDFGCVERQET